MTSEDILLKFEGAEIKGESGIKGHKDEIDVKSWSWSQSQTGTTHKGGGGGAGKVSIGDLIVQKEVDASTHALLKACSSGQHIPKAVLIQRKAGGEAAEYLKITIENVLVTSVTHATSGEGVDETVTLNFNKVKLEYHQQDEKGKLGPAKTYTWDVQANVAT